MSESVFERFLLILSKSVSRNVVPEERNRLPESWYIPARARIGALLLVFIVRAYGEKKVKTHTSS